MCYVRGSLTEVHVNSPQVSCLGMNPGRGWNPNLEESYLLEYSESELKLGHSVHQDVIFDL